MGGYRFPLNLEINSQWWSKNVLDWESESSISSFRTVTHATPNQSCDLSCLQVKWIVMRIEWKHANPQSSVQMKGMLFWWVGERMQGKAGFWAVYATSYKALIMQQADPTQQSSNRPYCTGWVFFVSADIGWSSAEFSVIGGWQCRKGPHSEPLLSKKRETWEPGRVYPHTFLTLWLTLDMSVRKKNHRSFAIQIKRSEVVCLLVCPSDHFTPQSQCLLWGNFQQLLWFNGSSLANPWR